MVGKTRIPLSTVAGAKQWVFNEDKHQKVDGRMTEASVLGAYTLSLFSHFLCGEITFEKREGAVGTKILGDSRGTRP